MIELGRKQKLQVVKTVEFGVYLATEDNEEERILLPGKQVPAGTKEGSKIEVFVYKDSSDRLIATVNEPQLMLGEVKMLTVVQNTKIGAFLNWGLEKDLLLPYKEQTKRVQEGDKVLVALYEDKTGRLCATMKVYPYLSCNSPYKKDMIVAGHIYEVSEKFGTYIAIDDQFSAMISPNESIGQLQPGDSIVARVERVKEDGKLDLTLREKAYLQMDKDAVKLMELLEQNNGVLGLTDKSSSEVIKEKTGLSKNAFKRAVGRLYKERKIEITNKDIRRI